MAICIFTFMKRDHRLTQRSTDLVGAFIFYCCVINYYKFSGFQQKTFHVIVSMGQKSRLRSAASLLQVSSDCSPGFGLIWRLEQGMIFFQAHPYCWENSFPCGWRIKGPCFLLSVGGHPQFPGLSMWNLFPVH